MSTPASGAGYTSFPTPAAPSKERGSISGCPAAAKPVDSAEEQFRSLRYSKVRTACVSGQPGTQKKRAALYYLGGFFAPWCCLSLIARLSLSIQDLVRVQLGPSRRGW